MEMLTFRKLFMQINHANECQRISIYINIHHGKVSIVFYCLHHDLSNENFIVQLGPICGSCIFMTEQAVAFPITHFRLDYNNLPLNFDSLKNIN